MRHPNDAPIDRAPRRITVFVGIVSAIVLFGAMFVLLTLRAFEEREPSHVAIVVGNHSWLGAQLIVSGPSLRQPHEAYIDSIQRYSVPFFLPPGQYELVVRVGEVEVYQTRFELDEQSEIEVPLPRQGPATAPASS